ncbi:hypothetical protein BsWGS_00561 [Bradybaena similaris]
MDRFLAICAHSRWRIMKRGAMVILSFIWIFSLAVQVPWVIYYQQWTEVTSSQTFYICGAIWPDFNSQRAFFVLAIFVGTYLLPLSFVFLCYLLIAWHVWHRRPPGVAVGNEIMMHRCRNKVIIMLITVVVTFALSWLPLHVLFLVLYFDPPSDQAVLQKINDVGVPLAQVLELSNTGTNVFIYSFFSGNFRRGFVQLWQLLLCNRKSAAGTPVVSTNRSMSEYSAMLTRSRRVQIVMSSRCDSTRNISIDERQSAKRYFTHVCRGSMVSLTNSSRTEL